MTAVVTVLLLNSWAMIVLFLNPYPANVENIVSS